MSINISTKGYYFGYKTLVVIFTKSGRIKIYDEHNIDYVINSNDSPTPATSTTTLHNIPTDIFNKIQRGDHIIVYSGPTDLYGITGEGNITQIQQNSDDGTAQNTVITFVEGVNLSSKALKANFNGAKTVKKAKSKKINATFKKNATAKQILTKVAKLSNIKIYHFKLAKNKKYKRGYTISNHPYNAMKKIVNDCDSKMYQRKGKLVIDDLKTDNPFKEHLFLSLGSGLLQEPSLSDNVKNSKTYTLECWDDTRLCAGSCVYVKSKNLDNLYKVQSVQHTHNNNYRMEVIIYG
ncbi:hypothetical protein DY120_07435 [Apilactobacillus micheneri]|uniref:Uncharacterized protein n=1 Tax=Apilactobacillus micheneri TaxID=1899430 RepID=A0ABY2YV58_9LACO|nr:hypothetical protein [Apilactobacillus micheneri]TPR23130.1 hypothetical protein DY114_07420 [Apilactobacillus micheneri]TPR24448.1 hypothetical protein DY111_07435 [Apilactobacillus micheneri]TPR29395.1 hypothetical protein DY120_07435 [Apilactobacillus micheneri]TPR34602.1 hypothetical protein DY027_07425 [Apilactobacillus micheneri]